MDDLSCVARKPDLAVNNKGADQLRRLVCAPWKE